jgi:hypothetical protein
VSLSGCFPPSLSAPGRSRDLMLLFKIPLDTGAVIAGKGTA